MTETRTCPKCGSAVPADAPGGICPKCLIAAGLASDSGSPPSQPETTSSNSTGFIPPDPASLTAKFPQLEILELLGRGGMGAVYKARQRELDRIVAVKILPPEVGQDPAFAQRFMREARALAKLNHQNIVQVHDFGRNDEFFFFVMEYVDGASLREIIRAGGVEPSAALDIVPQICAALQFAHDEGIVHRDIKPENILIDTNGRVKIADFGLAKMMGRATEASSLTATHQVMGTVHYMAPEQSQGSGTVDHRADIYSLGVLFYEMLTGVLPIGRFEPPSKRVELDVRVDEVVLRALENNPEYRYQQASDVKSDVERISVSPTQAVYTPPQTPGTEMDRELARHQVRGPAIGLLVAGTIQCMFFAALLGIFFLAIGPERPAHVPSAISKSNSSEPTVVQEVQTDTNEQPPLDNQENLN